MTVSAPSRQWMQALARVRVRAAKLRARPGAGTGDMVELLDETLGLTDAIRAECAALQQRCAELAARLDVHEREARELRDLLPTAVVATDAAGIIVEANAAGAALLGRSAARLKQQMLLHYSEDRDAFAALVRQLADAPDPICARIRLRPRERGPLDVDVTIARDARSGDARWLWCMNRANGAAAR